jgi:hypothetical protein
MRQLLYLNSQKYTDWAVCAFCDQAGAENE